MYYSLIYYVSTGHHIMEKRAYTKTALAVSLVPRQLPAFQCCMKNSGMAWYTKSSVLRIGGKEGRNNLIFAFGQVKGQQISESSRLQQLRDKAMLIVTECTMILLVFRKVMNNEYIQHFECQKEKITSYRALG